MALRTFVFQSVFRQSRRLFNFRCQKLGLSQVYVPKVNYCNDKPISQTFEKITKELEDKSLNWHKTSETKKTRSVATYTYWIIGASITLIGTYIIYEFGKPDVDENGNILIDEYSEKPFWLQYILRCYKQMRNFAILIQEPSREKLLPDPFPYPYYQPPYTLVLEFTDVLAHPDWTYKTGWRFKKRPGLDYLMENLVGLYEIVVFTAEPGITIFPVIEAVDPRNLISYKLVRDSTHFIDGHHVKNLSKLNRDLSKVIVVDWNAMSVKFHPENHLQVKKWNGDDDNILIDLTEFLKTIAQTEIEDVRDVLRFYKQFDDPLKAFRIKQMEYFESQKQAETGKQKQVTSKPFYSFFFN